MRLATVLVTEAGRATGPDLTRYLVVCVASIAALLGLAWLLRRTVGGRFRARAARRSLQVLDVLPLAGKQKLVVVRCYDRSFLIGTGEKEVRMLAELDAAPRTGDEIVPSEARPPGTARAFGAALEGELLRPAPAASLGSREGVLA
jgi:flagellar biosynthetic protein FliO